MFVINYEFVNSALATLHYAVEMIKFFYTKKYNLNK